MKYGSINPLSIGHNILSWKLITVLYNTHMKSGHRSVNQISKIFWYDSVSKLSFKHRNHHEQSRKSIKILPKSLEKCYTVCELPIHHNLNYKMF